MHLCKKYSSRLVTIHNEIPFQRWTEQDLLADRDETRIFHAKWELSQYAKVGTAVVGFGLAFDREADDLFYPCNCLYMHRMAIAPEWRSRGIGVILHCHSLNLCFKRRLQVLQPSPKSNSVFGQTNATKENQKLVQFHKDAGYRIVGEKAYTDRSDWIMELTENNFLQSRHFPYWRQCITT